MAGKGKPFGADNPGNMGGRPKGSRNATTRALEAILDGEAETLTRKAIGLAQGGDTVALRMCLDRLIPVRKDRPITFVLPEIETAADLTKATGAIVAAVASGELTPLEAAELAKTLDVHVRAIEATDLHRRLAALEAQGQ